MKSKKIKSLIATILLCSMVIGTGLTIRPSANTVIPVQEINGVKYVSLTDLTNATPGGIVNEATSMGTKTYFLNGKSIVVNTKLPFVNVDDKTIPYETKEIDGIKVPKFDAEKAVSDKGELLFPISILEEYLGLKPNDEGFVVKKEEKPNDNNSGSDNNGGSSNGGSTDNGGSNNNGGGSSSGGNSGGGSTGNGGGNSGGGSNNGGGGGTPTPPPVEPTPPPKPVDPPTPPPVDPPKPPSEPNGMSGQQLAGVAESYGWESQGGGGYQFNGRSGNLGVLQINGNLIGIGVTGFSGQFESCLRSTFNAVIPNGANKVMQMINSGSDGSFSANNRTVSVTHGGTSIEIR